MVMKTNKLMEECRKKFSDDKINQRIRLESGYLDRAYMIGYNCACEKVLQYLSEYTDYHDCGDYDVISLPYDTREEMLECLKQHLHPYSVEQIDNCTKEK
jgi:hypothetical protein